MHFPVKTYDADSDENIGLLELARQVIAQPEAWFYQENDQLGGNRPQELAGTEKEYLVRELLKSIKYGIPS